MVVNIGDLYDTPTKDIEGFNERLVKLFPGIKKHFCSLGYEGGFLERLKEGTYVSHVMEHLILELQSIMGYEVYYGKTRVVSEPSLYYIVFEYVNEKCAIECGRAAIDIISALVENKDIDTEKILEEIKKVAVESELGPSTKAIYDEARRRGIPVMRLGDGSLLQLGYGKYSRMVQASLTDATSCISADIASNKQLAKQLLMQNDIPVPYGDIVYTEEAAVRLAASIGYPVVVKPYDSNQGKGVTLNITEESQVRLAYNEALKYSKFVIVEKFIEGKDYRVLVIGDKVSAVAERTPPIITGDGVHTIKELVEIENKNPLRGDGHEKPLTKIKLDNVSRLLLTRSGLDENYIPAANEKIKLRENGNLSTGGSARSCKDEIHPDNAKMAINAAKIIGLDIAGIDIIAQDISKPIDGENGAIIEVNAAPGLRMHLYPSEGRAENVASDVLDMMFPKDKPYSIPIVAITGTNGKTTTTRLVKHTISLTGKKVGMTSTSGVYIGEKCILKGDNTGPASAKLVLTNREVEAAVLETARGGIVRKGLGYDLADVGVITNISEDHLGLDNVDTLEDLAYVKSLVIEAVKPDGYAVINADDLMADFLIKRARSKIILFSKQKDNLLIKSHIKKGGRAVYVSDGIMYIHHEKGTLPLIKIENIPITMGGKLDCNIENSLAASAALYALGIPIDTIKAGLKTFNPDVKSNPGRFNIFDMGNFKVMLDYGHNPAGYKAVIDFINKMDVKRCVGVIGMPGDRPDRSIKEVGVMCSRAFSRIYIKEDRDLRGRAPGEVAGIFYNAIIGSGYKKDNVIVINSELKALEAAILDAQPGDLIVMFYEEFEPAVELINKFKDELSQNRVKKEIAVGGVML